LNLTNILVILTNLFLGCTRIAKAILYLENIPSFVDVSVEEVGRVSTSLTPPVFCIEQVSVSDLIKRETIVH
jgi:hypothetical protein